LTKSLGVKFFDEENDERKRLVVRIRWLTKDDREFCSTIVTTSGKFRLTAATPEPHRWRWPSRQDRVSLRASDPKERSIDPAKPLLLPP